MVEARTSKACRRLVSSRTRLHIIDGNVGKDYLIDCTSMTHEQEARAVLPSICNESSFEVRFTVN